MAADPRTRLRTLAVASLLLAIRQNIGCWAAGIASTLIYAVLFFRASPYTEALLQLFYIGVSVYGWWHWSRPREPLPVTRWPWRRQLQALAAVCALGLANGALLAAFTPEEVRQQLAAAGLGDIRVRGVSDRHWLAAGRLP